jgi:iron(III) transport system substrate-binding protein
MDAEDRPAPPPSSAPARPTVTLRSPLRRWWPLLAVVAVVVIAGAALLVSTRESSDALVVYNGRSHYGGEEAFAAFTRETGIKVELFGGDAQTLHDRLLSEGDDTPADLLVTVDGANLWRAKEEGLLMAVQSATIEENIPASLRDPDGTWTAVSTRVRTPIVSTTRVPDGAVTSYEDLGDPQWKGRLCLRTANSIYNQSFVADMIAKRGEEATRQLLETWMDNDPQILGNDIEVIDGIASGSCDVGLVNHYYLAREIGEDPDLEVAPAWPDQTTTGAHANLSGVGVVAATDRREDAIRLMEFLTTYEAQQSMVELGEFPANPGVEANPVARPWQQVVKIEPIDVVGAGENAVKAVALMQSVGWE